MTEAEMSLGAAQFEVAHKIAREWADVPTPKLVAVLDSMEKQLVREARRAAKQDERKHELEVMALREAERRHELELAKLQERQKKAANAHVQHLVGVAAGAVVSLTSIGGAIWFGVNDHYWPMAIVLGPVLLALTKMFVLRKSDPGDISAAATTVTKMLRQAPAPAPPPVDPAQQPPAL
nr:hypothetical protein [Streptomyces sp. TLI_235]